MSIKSNPTVRELLILVILSIAAYGLALGAGLFEPVHQLIENGLFVEDQLLLGLAIVGLSSAIFAGRRWLELNQEATRREQVQATLEQERAFLRQVIDAVPGMIGVKDADGRFTLANQALAAAYGSSVEAMLGQTLADFKLEPAEFEQFLAHDREVLASGRIYLSPEEAVTHADGQRRWYTTYTAPLIDPAGRNSQVLFISTDITAQQEDRERIRFQARLLDAVGQAVIATDVAGRIFYWNQAATTIYGWSAEEAMGHQVIDLLVPESQRAESAKITITATTAGFWQGEMIRCHRTGQELPIFITLTAFTDSQGRFAGLMGVSTDISERKEIEAALRASQVQYQSVAEEVQALNAGLEERVQQRTAELLEANDRLTLEIDRRQQAQDALQHRAEMQKLIATLSTRFIDLAPEALNQAFDRALQRIGEFTGVDRSYIFLLTDDGSAMDNTHEWCAAGIEPEIEHLQGVPLAATPWWMAKLRKQEHIQVRRLADLPPEASQEKEILAAQQIQSVLVVPLVSAGMLIGFLGFDSVRVEKAWLEAEVSLLRLAGEIFASALQRQRAEIEIRHRNRELAMLNQVIDASASAMEPIGMLTIACQELVEALNLSQARAFWFNDAKSEARVVADYFRSADWCALDQVIAVVDHPWLGQVLAERLPLIFKELPAEADRRRASDLLGPGQLESVLVVPLLVHEDIVGVLSLGAERARAFPIQELNLIWRVAEQISVALVRLEWGQTHQRLATAIEQVTDAVVMSDPAGQIVYVNSAFSQLTGYSPAEVLGQNPRLLKSGQNDPALYTEMWSTITAGQTWRGRLVNKKKDGSFYTCDTAITPVYNEYFELINYVAVKRDVTHTLQLEEQYRQAQKMESVGRLAGGVAHDFNNILTAIMGYTGLSLRGLPADSPIQPYLQGVEASAERAANLTRQLLAFARKQDIQPQPVNLNELLTGTSKILRRLISEDIELVMMPGADLGWVTADPGQLEQVLFNLVVNARDAMPQGGKLTLKTANVTLSQAEAQRYAEVAPDDYVLLTVSDTGTGMSDEIKAHIFEPFFTTKAPGQGTGLGLATCFGIVKQSHGHIWVESAVNQGTTFSVYFPRTRHREVRAAQAAASHAVLPRGTETVMLVEDELLSRDSLACTLRELGYTVLEAENGERALQELEKLGGEKLNLLITDLVMPRLGGQALIEQVRPRHPDLKIILMSGYTDNVATRHHMAELGVVFLQKPFSSVTIATKVRQVLK